ncbi:hypothetical protein I302_104567 [Kwoniella bestiolae CBS 10118]|uniref:PinX1-related protein 1 n=1 Tax=Kwoniella bestiolae CBS 10118 TaxID=1296100 RepID=A0A1B9GBL3_9TREE|nr:hypothetical protein I302_03273 [Kwoniella bestiolae CBS 10118]OCF28414.1 hypothetical protein I302_03273 [Kwoniella bestiolae CBS 10118]
MGLSERKVKQKIGLDPRNLTWSDDKSRFSYKHMTALGWDSTGGLGASGDGNPNHIAVIRKSDNGGIGMDRARKDGSDMAAGAGQAGRGLEDVLKRIAAASASPSPSPGPEAAPAPAQEENKVIRNRIASRQRHLNSKRMASQSPAALAEILGVPVSSLPSTSSPSSSAPSTPQPSMSTPNPESGDTTDERTADETVTKSTLSVSDYFRQKMREKMAARQAAAGPSGGEVKIDDLPSSSLEHLSNNASSSSKPVGGTAWEGEKMQFEEKEVEFDPSSGPVDEDQPRSQEKEKKNKKDKKDKKSKKDKSGTSTPIAGTGEGEDPIHVAAEHLHEFEHAGENDKEKKRREKEEKKRRKEEKKAEKVEVEKGKGKEKKRKRDDEVEDAVTKKEKKDKKDKDKAEKKEEKEKKEKSSS